MNSLCFKSLKDSGQARIMKFVIRNIRVICPDVSLINFYNRDIGIPIIDRDKFVAYEGCLF